MPLSPSPTPIPSGNVLLVVFSCVLRGVRRDHCQYDRPILMINVRRSTKRTPCAWATTHFGTKMKALDF